MKSLNGVEIENEKIILSIVIVTYNAQNVVAETIESVLQQKGYSSNFTIEFLFIDGNSSDNTISVIETYKQVFKEKGINYCVICENDKGIYDAMNKGVEYANGKWVYMLNAGDTLYNETIFKQVEEKLITSNVDVLYGTCCRTNQYIRQLTAKPKLESIKINMILCHQAIFIRREISAKIKYNLKYKLVADYHAVLSMYLENYKFEYLPVCVVNYDINGVSAKKMVETYKEIYIVRKDLGIIDNKLKYKCLYYYGLIKRITLSKMPQNLRWNLLRVKRKFIKNQSLY